MDAAVKPTWKYLRRVRQMKVPTELAEILYILRNVRVDRELRSKYERYAQQYLTILCGYGKLRLFYSARQ